MNSNRSVPCQVLLNVSSISDIFDACICNLDLPILSSFSSLSTCSKVLEKWAGSGFSGKKGRDGGINRKKWAGKRDLRAPQDLAGRNLPF